MAAATAREREGEELASAENIAQAVDACLGSYDTAQFVHDHILDSQVEKCGRNGSSVYLVTEDGRQFEITVKEL